MWVFFPPFSFKLIPLGGFWHCQMSSVYCQKISWCSYRAAANKLPLGSHIYEAVGLYNDFQISKSINGISVGGGLRAGEQLPARGPAREGLRAAAAPGRLALATVGTAASQGQWQRAAGPEQSWGISHWDQCPALAAALECGSDLHGSFPLVTGGKRGPDRDLGCGLDKIHEMSSRSQPFPPQIRMTALDWVKNSELVFGVCHFSPRFRSYWDPSFSRQHGAKRSTLKHESMLRFADIHTTPGDREDNPKPLGLTSTVV